MQRQTVLRRSMLQGGAAAALSGWSAGCPGASPPPDIERRFVGQDPTLGHRLRDANLRAHAPQRWQRCDVLIVGGGAAGASAAWRLRRGGLHDVVLLELESEAGGTARGGQMARSRYPMGAHYLPTPPREFAALHTLLDDLGLSMGRDAQGQPEYDPRVIARAPVERHRLQGRWEEGLYPAAGQTPDEEAQWERWWVLLRDLDAQRDEHGRRCFALPLDRSSPRLRFLDGISMATYLDRLGFTSWRLRWLVDYACRDDYGCRIEDTSAFAALHHFLARGLEDAVDRPILTWPQGNAWLVEHMLGAAGLDSRHHSAHAVVAIDPDAGRVTALDLTSDRLLGFEASTILWAAPRFVLPHVLPRGRDPLPRGALTYAPWIVASLELERPPAGHGAPPAWDNVAITEKHLGYVVATHNEPLTETRKSAVVTFYEPLTGDPRAARQRLLEGSLEHWSTYVEDALGGMHGELRADVRRIHIARWGHGMVRPTPGALFGPTRALAAASIGRVWPCAADVGGLPLFEQAFAEGVRAAEVALARHGLPSASLLSPVHHG